MKDNADAAAKDVQILPTNPPALQQQIEGASKQSVETAQKGIEASASYARKPLLFSVSASIVNFCSGLWDSKLSANVLS
jgi:hypothetical protein